MDKKEYLKKISVLSRFMKQNDVLSTVEVWEQDEVSKKWFLVIALYPIVKETTKEFSYFFGLFKVKKPYLEYESDLSLKTRAWDLAQRKVLAGSTVQIRGYDVNLCENIILWDKVWI